MNNTIRTMLTGIAIPLVISIIVWGFSLEKRISNVERISRENQESIEKLSDKILTKLDKVLDRLVVDEKEILKLEYKNREGGK